MKQNIFNVSDSELKTFKRVSLWTEVITQQGVGFQVKFFVSCQSLNFVFINKQSVFAKQTWNKKNWIFLPLYKRRFLHSACFSQMHYWDWKFSGISFWVETSNVSDSELNVFQRVKFKNTISKIPRILDWVFYNVPDFEIKFLLREKLFGKKYWIETHHFFIDIFQEKDDNFVNLFASLKCSIVNKTFICQSDFESKQLQLVRFWITNFKPVRFSIKAFRTCHTLNWYFFWKNQHLKTFME